MSSAVAVALSNPFPGLRPFREGEEHLFFGRESQVDAMVDKLAAKRFLAVLGSSGSGKSSLVNCGLRPALHRGLMASAGTSWRMAQFRPGAEPIRAMAQALAEEGVLFDNFQAPAIKLADMIEATLRIGNLGLVDIFEQAHLQPGVNLLLVVDQFEELFRYRKLGTAVRDKAQERSQVAAAFVSLLLQARRQQEFPIYLVLTMRSDFLGDCTEFAELPEAINDGQYLVPRLTRDELKAAISGPLGVYRCKISSVLLTRLVNDVGDNPDQLSVLQHALNRTWAHWHARAHFADPLDLDDYESIGTMARALDQHAQEAFDELKSEDDKKLCERIFKTLTDKGTDGRGVRRPVSFEFLGELTGASAEELTRVIDVFRQPSRSFLMPPLTEKLKPETIIDISHESLMRVWKTLTEWSEAEAQSAQLFSRLVSTAQLHEKRRAGLWRDPDLSLALEWRQKEKPTRAWAELYGGRFDLALDFLKKSEDQRDAELHEKEDQRRRELEAARALAAEQQQRAEEQAKAARRLRLAFAAALLLAVLACAVAFYARIQQGKAKDSEDKAQINAENALRAKLAADRATEAAKKNLATANAAEQAAKTAGEAAEKEKAAAEYESRRNLSHELAGASTNLSSDERLSRLLALQSAFVTYRDDRKVDKEALEALERVAQSNAKARFSSGHTSNITSAVFNNTGSRIVTASYDGTARIWDASSGLCLLTLSGHTNAVLAAVFSPDGKWVATAGQDRTVKIWDASSGKEIHTLGGHFEAVVGLAFDPGGNLLASASLDTTAKIWDLRSILNSGSGEVLTLKHQAAVASVAFTPDGKLVATGSNDGNVKIWDASSGREKTPGLASGSDQNPPFHQIGQVSSVAFSPDGQLLATSGQTAQLWEASTGKHLQTFPYQIAFNAVFSPDGKHLAVVYDGAAKIYDVKSAVELLHIPLPYSGFGNKIAFSPDGKRLVSCNSPFSAVSVWDSSFGQQLATLQNLSSGDALLVSSADGKLSAFKRGDGRIGIRDGSSGMELFTLSQGPRLTATGVISTFSANGHYFALLNDKRASLWEIGGGPRHNPLHEMNIDGGYKSLSVSGDGLRIAALNQGLLKIWDTTNGSVLPGSEPRGITSIVFSPTEGSDLLATGSEDGKIQLLDTSGRIVRVLAGFTSGHKGGLSTVVFSADGKSLATFGLRDNTVKLWTLSGGILSGGKTPLEHDGVSAVAVSPNASLVATYGSDRTVRLWNIKGHTEEEILSLPVEWYSAHLAFDAEGQYLTVSTNALLRVYPLRIPTALNSVLSQISAPWSTEACAKYLHSASCPQWAVALGNVADGNNFARALDRSAAVESFRRAQALDGALKLDAENQIRTLEAETLFASGQRAAAVGDEQKALDYFKKAQQLRPIPHFDPSLAARSYAAAAYLAKGRNLARANNVQEAISSLQFAKDRDPESPDPKTEAGRLAAVYLINRGNGLAKTLDIDAAIKSYEQAELLSADSVKFDPRTQANGIAAKSLVSSAQDSAKAGNIQGAIQKFRRAKELDPDAFSFDPEMQAKVLAAQHLLAQGQEEAANGHVDEAIADFGKAKEFDPSLKVQPNEEANRKAAEFFVNSGKGFMKEGKVPEAIANYSKAVAAFERVPSLDPNGAKRANTWNDLCLSGSLRGHAADVMDACEHAVKLSAGIETLLVSARDSRGLARALTHNRAGAIDDFNFVAGHTARPDQKQRCQKWMADLQAGKDLEQDLLDQLASQ